MQTDRPKLTRAAELAGVVSATLALVSLFVALLAWLAPQSPAEEDQKPSTFPPSAPADHASASRAAVTSSPVINDTFGTGLAGITVLAGQNNNIPVPERYAGDRYRGAVAMACGSGEAKDQFREVKYSIDRGYERFRAVLAPQLNEQGSSKKINLQVEIFADGKSIFNDVVATADESPLDLDVAGAEALQFRVTCSRSQALLLILQSSLT